MIACVLSGGLLISLEAIAAHLSGPPFQDAVATSFPIAATLVWAQDLDGDGLADIANPTHNFIRGLDAYGSGQFGARRDRGKRKHEGADYVAAPGSTVFSPLNGVVTAMGFAYHNDENLRFVEVRDDVRQMSARIFYIEPSVVLGQALAAGDAIGAAESLDARYPHGMTNHVHVEIRNAQGKALDPGEVLPTLADAVLMAQARPNPSPSPVELVQAAPAPAVVKVASLGGGAAAP